MGTSSPSPVIDTPNSGLFIYDEEKEKSFLNSVGKIDLKELFMESLSPEFLKLFKKNINLFYSQPFYEGISYEYGLFDKSKNLNKAFKIYKDAADFKYDYLCMYRMHRIYFMDYKNFGVQKNEDLHRFYLYKCFAYLPYAIITKQFFLLYRIDATIIIISSFIVIIAKIQKGIIFLIISAEIVLIWVSLSAKGSINFPKSVIKLYFLAINPSNTSVKLAITYIMEARRYCS